jgi:hypothetical protein
MDKQNVFVPGKSFFGAVQQLLTDVCNASSQLKGYMYGLLVNYGKAFGRLDRRRLMQKLESELGKHNPIVTIIRDIFGYFLWIALDYAGWKNIFFKFFPFLV